MGILDYPESRIEKSRFFQSKTLTVKNKNLKFSNFLSPFLIETYERHAIKYSRIFDSKLHTRLIIEAGFFCLPPRLECLVFCGGLPPCLPSRLECLILCGGLRVLCTLRGSIVNLKENNANMSNLEYIMMHPSLCCLRFGSSTHFYLRFALFLSLRTCVIV